MGVKNFWNCKSEPIRKKITLKNRSRQVLSWVEEKHDITTQCALDMLLSNPLLLDETIKELEDYYPDFKEDILLPIP